MPPRRFRPPARSVNAANGQAFAVMAQHALAFRCAGQAPAGACGDRRQSQRLRQFRRQCRRLQGRRRQSGCRSGDVGNVNAFKALGNDAKAMQALSGDASAFSAIAANANALQGLGGAMPMPCRWRRGVPVRSSQPWPGQRDRQRPGDVAKSPTRFQPCPCSRGRCRRSLGIRSAFAALAGHPQALHAIAANPSAFASYANDVAAFKAAAANRRQPGDVAGMPTPSRHWATTPRRCRRCRAMPRRSVRLRRTLRRSVPLPPIRRLSMSR